MKSLRLALAAVVAFLLLASLAMANPTTVSGTNAQEKSTSSTAPALTMQAAPAVPALKTEVSGAYAPVSKESCDAQLTVGTSDVVVAATAGIDVGGATLSFTATDTSTTLAGMVSTSAQFAAT